MAETQARRGGPPETGVNFCNGPKGRSSTLSGQRIFARSVRAHDSALAERILAERDWRRNYPVHIGDLTLVEARSAEAAIEIARTGTAAAQEEFVNAALGGDLPLGSAAEPPAAGFDVAEIVGSGEREREFVIPYRGAALRGDALLRQLDVWVAAGTVEPSFGEALGLLVRNPDWLDLSDRAFALLGAGAQMGPFQHLMSWGARVAAIDIPRPDVWRRLIETAQRSAGRMMVPLRSGAPALADPADFAGADLLTEVGALVEWLAAVPGPLTLGNYGYMDGAAFVRLSMAYDLLLESLRARRTDLSFAYLATPSDAFLVPADAVRMAQERLAAFNPAMIAARLVCAASGGKLLRPNYSELSRSQAGAFGLVNAFIVDQGPNYALAKRLQRWRMILTRTDGLLTSVHVAPPTKTASVHKNPAMEERQRITAWLGIETFDAAASQAIAAGILVHDLRNPGSPANPATPMNHPHEAFMFAANPGGRWRAALDPQSSIGVLRGLENARMAARGLIGARGQSRPENS